MAGLEDKRPIWDDGLGKFELYDFQLGLGGKKPEDTIDDHQYIIKNYRDNKDLFPLYDKERQRQEQIRRKYPTIEGGQSFIIGYNGEIIPYSPPGQEESQQIPLATGQVGQLGIRESIQRPPTEERLQELANGVDEALVLFSALKERILEIKRRLGELKGELTQPENQYLIGEMIAKPTNKRLENQIIDPYLQ